MKLIDLNNMVLGIDISIKAVTEEVASCQRPDEKEIHSTRLVRQFIPQGYYSFTCGWGDLIKGARIVSRCPMIQFSNRTIVSPRRWCFRTRGGCCSPRWPACAAPSCGEAKLRHHAAGHPSLIHIPGLSPYNHDLSNNVQHHHAVRQTTPYTYNHPRVRHPWPLSLGS